MAALFTIGPTVAAAATGSPGIIEEVVVTGTAGGSEIRKFDASFAITTASAEDIDRFSPTSTADMLKVVPGIWAESSGGIAGANVFVRGFPAPGDAPFLTVQVDGVPIYPPSTLAFLENTTLFRIDTTIERMEALRGGPNPVFSNGQPGLTTNFILREGGPETEGLVRYTTSDYDLNRFDGYVSGEISEGFYYMIGGYLRSSPGIREAGFTSDEGHQGTVKLTRDFEQGTVSLFHRDTDDHGTWYLPVALNVPGVDNEYNQLGIMNKRRLIQFANDSGADPENAETSLLNLGEGRGWDGSVTGGAATFEFADNWEVTDRFGLTKGDADTLGLVPAGGAVRVGDLLADPAADPNAVVIGPITGSVSGRPIGEDEYIQQFGGWEVRKAIEAFTNDLSVAYDWGRGDVTVGLYTANVSADDVWSIDNTKYEVVQDGGEVVTGIACNAPEVDSCGANTDLDATGDATTTALYAATTIDVSDRLTLDFGIRRENHEVQYSADLGRDGQVDLVIDFDETEISWTAAANYLLNDFMSTFARINTGSRMPYFDDFRDNADAFFEGNDLIQDVDQYELGFKWVTDAVSLYLTGFYTEVDPSIFVAQSGAGPGQISTNEAIGLEVDAIWDTDWGFQVNLNATIQDTEFKSGENDGNETQRQPGWQLRLTPSYTFTTGAYETTLYGTFTAVDDRWSDPGNTVELDGYETLDLGAMVRINQSFVVQIAADNVTDEEGLTEGDPRNPASPNGRFIMPRSVELSLGYEF
ncbi:MAG TPA: TonB-dependent receptor [Pseudomonadales bacterium]